MSWAMATSPDELDPASGSQFNLRNAAMAIQFGQDAVRLTGQQDAKALDSLAAAFAEGGHFNEAVQAGNLAANLADREKNGALAAQIRSRIALYAAGKPYRCKPDGSDRP